ncbi:hypothetical protein J7643_16845 [bacterium]|nr:hypothetical protein [bacterium]
MNNPSSLPVPATKQATVPVVPQRRRVPIETLHFGALLIARRIIDAHQLDEALRVQASSPYLRIGEILLGLGFISFAQLKSTLEDQYQDIKLGDTLMKLGLVSLEQIGTALETQERTGDRLAPVLIDMGACTEAQIYRALSVQEGKA